MNNQVPTFAITSLTGLLGIGLVVLLGWWLIARLLIPIAAIAAPGVILGGAVTYIARNY